MLDGVGWMTHNVTYMLHDNLPELAGTAATRSSNLRTSITQATSSSAIDVNLCRNNAHFQDHGLGLKSVVKIGTLKGPLEKKQ